MAFQKIMVSKMCAFNAFKLQILLFSDHYLSILALQNHKNHKLFLFLKKKISIQKTQKHTIYTHLILITKRKKKK